jgi:hypothetical protein
MLLLNSAVEIQCESKHKRIYYAICKIRLTQTQDGNTQIFSLKVFRPRAVQLRRHHLNNKNIFVQLFACIKHRRVNGGSITTRTRLLLSTTPISNFFAQLCFHDANSAGNEYNQIK